MKKLLCLTLCLFMAASAFVACDTGKDGEHAHTYADGWQYNESEHWHDATCEHTDLTSDKGAHVDSDNNDICDTCGYVKDHFHTYEDVLSADEDEHFYKASCGHDIKKDAEEHADENTDGKCDTCGYEKHFFHTFEDTLSWDENEHYYKSTCGHEEEKKDAESHKDENNDGVCDGCEYDYGHTHSYADIWSATEGGHWHAPLCGHNIDGTDKEAHADGNNDGACDKCGDMGGHEHTYSETWSKDANEHWKEPTCTHTVASSEKGAHADKNGDKICDICGYEPPHVHTFESTWSYNEDEHWKKASCGHDTETSQKGLHADANGDFVCDVCEARITHVHTFADSWSFNEDGHWKAPTCGHDVEGAEKSAHIDSDNDTECDACGYQPPHFHTYEDTWSNDANEHWKDPTCGHDIEPFGKGAHTYSFGSDKCDVCGYELPHFHTFEDGFTSDAEKHWHKATCSHTDLRDGEAPHSGHEEDGVCDVCGYTVFKLYTVTVTAPDFITLTDRFDNAMTSTSAILKEGSEFIFKIAVPDNVKLEGVRGAEIQGTPVQSGEKYIYTLKVTVSSDLTVNIMANKLVGVEDVVVGGKIAIECEEWQDAFTEIKFTAEKPGMYAIYCLEDPWMKFGSSVEASDHESFYIIDVKDAGEVTLSAKYSSMGAGGSMEFTYYIGLINDNIVLPYLEGSGYKLPTMLPVHVTFILPKKGMYKVTSSHTLTWNNDVTVPYIIYAPEDNYEMKLEVKYNMDYPIKETTYDFDWSIEFFDGESKEVFKDVENDIKTVPGGFVKYHFVADTTGTYVFSAGNENTIFRGAWDTSYGGYCPTYAGTFRVTLNAGQTFTFFSAITSMNEAPEAYDDKLTITYRGVMPVYDEEKETYLSDTNVTCVYFGEEGTYTVTLPQGTQISLDGGSTWSRDSVEMVVEDSDYGVTYMVKGDRNETKKAIQIELKIFGFTIDANAEANVFTLEPEKEYKAFLESNGSSMVKSFKLTWTDPDVVVVYRGVEYNTGSLDIISMSSYGNQNFVTVIYRGTEAANVSFTLKDVTE